MTWLPCGSQSLHKLSLFRGESSLKRSSLTCGQKSYELVHGQCLELLQRVTMILELFWQVARTSRFYGSCALFKSSTMTSFELIVGQTMLMSWQERLENFCHSPHSRARAYCSLSFCMYIWCGRVGERIRSGRLCLRAAIAITYEAITHSVTWMVAFSSPLVLSWFRP